MEILSIAFAHVPSVGHSAALNVRKNANTEAFLPEWQPGRTAQDSRAVYALSDISVNPITIRVRLQTTDLQITNAYIAADVSIPSDQQRRGCNALAGLFTGQRANPDDLNIDVLGNVREQHVAFGTDGLSNEIEFTVDQRGVDYIASGKTTWMWKFRLSSTDSWTTFAQTAHTIYTIISHPKSPWVDVATDEVTRHHLLWTDLLEHACWWARGQKTIDAAAAAITRQLFERGSSSLNLLKYEHRSGSPSFANKDLQRFNLQGFLNAIDLGRTAATNVNCDDCANALVTMANGLGCDLHVAIIGAQPSAPGEGGLDRMIYLNTIRVIGSDWNHIIDSQSDDRGNFFWYHSVAMSGEGTYSDYVYDGMLQVTQSLAPSDRTALYVEKFLFGSVGDSDSGISRGVWERIYRTHLAKPDDELTHSQTYCSPRTDLKYRPALWWTM